LYFGPVNSASGRARLGKRAGLFLSNYEFFVRLCRLFEVAASLVTGAVPN